jgi:hypothetical protein
MRAPLIATTPFCGSYPVASARTPRIDTCKTKECLPDSRKGKSLFTHPRPIIGS